jgi:hypothetical protein
MARLTITLAAWLSIVSLASASLALRRDPPLFRKDPARAQPPRRTAQADGVLPAGRDRGVGSDFVVTERTEVLLNGKPCKYADVPGHATIVRMELAADGKTVLKVHFRTRK